MESSLADWSQCTPIYSNQTKYYYDPFRSTYKNIRFLLNKTSTYTVTKHTMGRIATISYNVYGTTTLWRVLLEYNQIHDPITELYPGVVLDIPDKAQAISYLTNANNINRSNTAYSSSFII
jgi:hypothetical protein